MGVNVNTSRSIFDPATLQFPLDPTILQEVALDIHSIVERSGTIFYHETLTDFSN
jgi:hypothetical protein